MVQQYAGMMEEWTRMEPEYTGMSWNDTATKRKDTSVTPE